MDYNRIDKIVPMISASEPESKRETTKQKKQSFFEEDNEREDRQFRVSGGGSINVLRQRSENTSIEYDENRYNAERDKVIEARSNKMMLNVKGLKKSKK